ncbi:hypothetical protein CGZ98_00035 [Enemella evansiae]|uniref:hypothetical protein n=1 Tax=Enemella evansiae TaxID=2016499 RepID=UPI000B9711D1|nr:hypothetical protein [Enemella evansiae]OYO14894.1 hypothetical protein CGZ98_00035 [Enemella evansiae]
MSQKTPSRKIARIAPWAAIPAALIVSGLIVSQASYSAFSAKTENTGNSWETGSVKLTDDDRGAAMFTVKNLRPGQQGEKCITVTSDGTSPSRVKLYAANAKATNQLDQYISIKVVQATSCGAGGTTIVDGPMAKFAAGPTNYANGVGDWNTTGNKGEIRTYMITYRFPDDAPNSTQASTAALDLVWEAQNL